jgi:outer membrane protein X
MKKVLSLLLMAMFSIGTFAQSEGDAALGINLNYGTEVETVGFGLKGQYNITDQFRVEAVADYWLKKNGVMNWDVEANVHYLVKILEPLAVYPIAGGGYGGFRKDAVDLVNVGPVSVKTKVVTGSNFFAIVGGGVQFNLSDNVFATAELKYQIQDGSQLVISAGIAYKF